jgi:hypothetical protein
MTRQEFTEFVQSTLEGVLRQAEEYTGKKLPRRIAFCWLGKESEVVREGIAEEIVRKTYVDEDHIYPCVDIGVGDLLEDGTPLIVARIAGYGPRPFQANWTDRDGPFVYVLGQPFLNRLAGISGKTGSWDTFQFRIPDMKNISKG